jgi:hypothetical protein
MEEKSPLRRKPEDHHFWSLTMLAVIAAAFLLVVWVETRTPVVFLRVANGPGLDQCSTANISLADVFTAEVRPSGCPRQG